MAQTHRKVIPVNVTSADEARDLLGALGLALEPQLTKRYGSRFNVTVEELYDPATLVKSVTGADAAPSDGAFLRQSISLFRGWLRGATLGLEWDAERPQQVVVKAEALSKLEDKATTSFAVSSGVLFAIIGFLTIRFRLLGALAGLVLGVALGIGMYYVVGSPIVALLQGSSRRTNDLFALELASFAPDWIGATGLVATAPDPAATPKRARRATPQQTVEREPAAV